MGKDSTIRVVAVNLVKKGVDGAIKSVSRLGKVTKKVMRGIGRVTRGATNSIKRLGMGFAAVSAPIILSTREANAFARQMAEVGTLLDDTSKLEGFSKGVRMLSAELGIAKDELSKGLYQALSAGVPPENALTFLRDASKGAVAGVSTVAASVDVLTTVLNAFKKDSSETAAVADILFQTVKSGKTTLSELSASMAQVAPVANSFGVGIEDVAAAIATLTKQGTPTAQAVTQIRAAILSTTEVLGDGWAKSMSLGEGFAAVAKQAGGSETKLREMLGRVEALNAVLGLTGSNAKEAAKDLAAMQKAGGAMDKAFRGMDKVRHWAKLWQALRGHAQRFGEAIDRNVAPLIEKLAKKLSDMTEKNKGFDKLGATIQRWAKFAMANLDNWIEKVKNTIGVAQATIKALIDEESRGETLAALGNVLFTALKAGALTAAQTLLLWAPRIGIAIGKWAGKAVAEFSKREAFAVSLKAAGLPMSEGRDIWDKIQASKALEAGEILAKSLNSGASDLERAIERFILAIDGHRVKAATTSSPTAGGVGGGGGGGGKKKTGIIRQSDLKPGEKVDPSATIVDDDGKPIMSGMSWNGPTTEAAKKMKVGSLKKWKTGLDFASLGDIADRPMSQLKTWKTGGDIAGRPKSKLRTFKAGDPRPALGEGLGGMADLKRRISSKGEIGSKNNRAYVEVVGGGPKEK